MHFRPFECDGKQWRTYTAAYRYKGKQYSVDIIAESWSDAEARLSALHFGKIDGELVARIPATPEVGLFMRPFVWLLNVFAKRKLE